MAHPPAFSVILPVYHGDKAEYLEQALHSLKNQSLRANEVLIVEDGPIGEALQKTLDQWQLKMPELRRHQLAKSQGLSAALNAGIEVAKNEWLARMDADDICHKRRFEKQMDYILAHPEVDILGAWIAEFEKDINKTQSLRKLPARHADIYRYAKWRCPFNHMTVLLRKSILEQYGKYKTASESNLNGFGEDYELWARLLQNGCTGANLPEVLVYARVTEDFFGRRRRGAQYLKNEYLLIKELYRMGFINAFQFLLHLGIKSVVRMAPPTVVRFIYGYLRKYGRGG